MFKFLALVALLAAVASAGALPRKTSKKIPVIPRFIGKIINGVETTIEEHPHQISLRVNDYHICGGSIISKDWVLTAAHCAGYPSEYYSIRAGSAHSEEGGSLHSVAEIIIHEDFGTNNFGTGINDIALIRVENAFELGETRMSVPMYHSGEETEPGLISVITGWGSTGSGYPLILNAVEVPIISKARCNELYAYLGGLPEGQICAAYEEGGKDACQGDSGGPLTVLGRLAGIVSWGHGCAVAKQPGVYTEVAYFRDWIRKHTGIIV